MRDHAGALALVLHSHMPYVEGFGTWPFGEEWLWEALATVYLPLLETLDGAPVTLGLTPVLCDQLEALRGEAGERFVGFMTGVREQVHREDVAGFEDIGDRPAADEIRRGARDYSSALEAFEGLRRDVLGAFAKLGDAAGGPELLASAATHAVLPLLATRGGRRLQVAAGLASHERRFGRRSEAFWLPECAYEPGLESVFAEAGVRAFCVDQTDALGLGALEHLEPVRTREGPVAVPIDWQSIGLVWDEHAGYPGHAEYRDYHARTYNDLKPWNNAGGIYDAEAATEVAVEHARDFLRRADERLAAFRADRGRGGLLCCPVDAELLGHWWYEGQTWLRTVLAEAPAHGIELLPLTRALARVEPVSGRDLAPSSWGRPKDLTTWDSPPVAELAFAARRGELGLLRAAHLCPPSTQALERAARELLALQSSDWAFQVSRAVAAHYPLDRARAHAAELEAALARALADSGPEPDPHVRNLAPALDLSPLLTP